MEQEDRQKFIIELDDELLKGGVVLSEWCVVMVREADIAFVAGANLATIVIAMAGVETYLRSEHGGESRVTLHKLIEYSPLEERLKVDLQNLRKYRNKWVHMSVPCDDDDLLDHPELYDCDLETTAIAAVRAFRQTIYENQWI